MSATTTGGKSIMAETHARKVFAWALTLQVLSILAGCTTMRAYPGPELPMEKVAVIRRLGKLVTPGYIVHVAVTTIDDSPVDRLYVQVLPGLHKLALVGDVSINEFTGLVALFQRKPKFRQIILTFRAEAGRSYELVPVMIENDTYSVRLVNNLGELPTFTIERRD
jgi:hypothetical protein